MESQVTNFLGTLYNWKELTAFFLLQEIHLQNTVSTLYTVQYCTANNQILYKMHTSKRKTGL